MFELLTATQNYAFTVALGLMLVIAVMEGAASFIGAGLSEFLDSLFPDLDVGVDIDVDMDVDASPSAFTRGLGWLRVGRVPMLIVLIVFLTAFGLIGLSLQSMAHGLIGEYLPGWIAVVAAMFLALPVVRVLGGAMAYIMPSDETDAVSEASFIGRIAVITLGVASLGSPAEAKLTDEHGHTHYVMVEPDMDSARFEQGTAVLLTERHGAVFNGILSSNDALTDAA